MLTTEGWLEQKSFQLVLEWVDGWCRCWDDVVRQFVPSLSGGNRKSSATDSRQPEEQLGLVQNDCFGCFLKLDLCGIYSCFWTAQYLPPYLLRFYVQAGGLTGAVMLDTTEDFALSSGAESSDVDEFRSNVLPVLLCLENACQVKVVSQIGDFTLWLLWGGKMK